MSVIHDTNKESVKTISELISRLSLNQYLLIQNLNWVKQSNLASGLILEEQIVSQLTDISFSDIVK